MPLIFFRLNCILLLMMKNEETIFFLIHEKWAQRVETPFILKTNSSGMGLCHLLS